MLRKLLTIGLTLITVQIIGQLVFEFNFYRQTIIVINKIEHFIKEPDDPAIIDPPLTPNTETCLPINQIAKDDFLIQFTDCKVMNRNLVIEFEISNYGKHRTIKFSDILYGDNRGAPIKKGRIALSGLDGKLVVYNDSDYNYATYKILNEAKIKGKIAVFNISDDAKKVVLFQFCWGHNKMRDQKNYCTDEFKFNLPKREWSDD